MARSAEVQLKNKLRKTCRLAGKPGSADPRVWLYFALGPKGYEKFQKRFGGRKIWFPKTGQKMPCAYCRREPGCIQELFRQGKSAARIAKEFNLSQKHVYALLKKSS